MQLGGEGGSSDGAAEGDAEFRLGGRSRTEPSRVEPRREGRAEGLRVMMPACNVARAGASSVGLLFREGSPSWQHPLQARGRINVFRLCGLQQTEVGKESKKPIC